MNPNVADAVTEPVERVRDLEPGDKVLWGERQVPLTVQDEDVYIDGPGDREVRMVTNEEQADGATYFLLQQFTDKLDPKVRKKVTPSARNPDGTHRDGYAEDLRRVVDD